MKQVKKTIALILALTGLLSIASTSIAATVTTNTNSVNIRSSTSTGSTLIGQVAKGTTLDVLGESVGQLHNGTNVWLHVRVIKCAAGSKHNIDGKTGYVNSSYVTGYTSGTTHPMSQDEAFGATGYIQEGSRGNYVVNVQKVLAEALLIGSGQIDGIFGSQTKEAVKRYQEKYWMDFVESSGIIYHIDGIVGPATKESMWKRFGNFLQTYGVK